MRRVRYYPTIEQIIHLAESFNVNVNMEHDMVYLFPTDELSAAECTLLGIPSMPSDTSCFGGDRHDLDTWAYNMSRNNEWLNYSNSCFVTFHE
ncbi:hypothetical protein NVP2275O_369 [Vibrio phage 2.275.O._10N.286.54.E11]|nr:hypothetical protein NVP2275O_369 [Vibrio phage 2.275.O._10N.286.54.E11]